MHLLGYIFYKNLLLYKNNANSYRAATNYRNSYSDAVSLLAAYKCLLNTMELTNESLEQTIELIVFYHSNYSMEVESIPV